ncbi:MAG: hypothetical protein ACTJG2_01730 [Candidatus Saccharimonadales bacterium]
MKGMIMNFVVLLLCLVAFACVVVVTVARCAKPDVAKLFAVSCVVIVSIVGAVAYLLSYHNERTATCHMLSKERSHSGDMAHYRLYTADCGTITNANSALRMKYNSTAIWHDVPAQGDVTLRVVGARIPLFQ